MYKYTFPKKLIAYIKKKTRKNYYWTGRYGFSNDYFKPFNFYFVLVEFDKNIDFTYHSKTKLNMIPFAGYLLPVKFFEETSI